MTKIEQLPRARGSRLRVVISLVVATLVAGSAPPAASAQGASPTPVFPKLTLVRMAATSDSFVVSSAIPLLPGAVRRQDVARLHLLVDGKEEPAYVAPTAGGHADGTLRSVLVQFRYSARPGDRIPAELQLMAGAPARLRAPFPLDSLAEAVLLPTDPNYLVATGLVGATLPVSQVRAMGGSWQRYEKEFERFADDHWDREGSKWSASNYYDRASIYYAWWIRTGNPEYWRRATLIAHDYRSKYVEPNKGGIPHHWSQLEGVALHYWLTGDEASRAAVGQTAEVLSSYYRRGVLGDVKHRSMEARIMARSLLSALLAWELRAPGKAKYDAAAWEREVPRMLDAVLAAQSPSGAFLFGAQCMHSLNYMTALLNEVFIRYYARFKPDPRIPASIKASGDWLMTTQWRNDGSFNYQSGFCKNNGSGPKAGRDLSGLFLNTYGWLYVHTGDARYRDFGDRLFNSSVQQAYLKGTKQFNQQYTFSYRYFAYRQGATS